MPGNSAEKCRWPKMPLPRRPRGLARRMRTEDTGSIVVLAAFVFPVMIGAFGLGAEAGYWYMLQRKLQHAADLASHAGGTRHRAGDSVAETTVAASYIAGLSGFDTTTGNITVNVPPLTGDYAGDGKSVEVILAASVTRWFSAFFADGDAVISARAVTQVAGGTTACVIALSPTANGAITVEGSTTVTLTGCDVASNSSAYNSFLMDGITAQITTGCVSAVGDAIITSGLTLTDCDDVVTDAPVAQDPYNDVPEPSIVGDCTDGKIGKANESTTLTPTYPHPSGMMSMRFCSGLDIKGQINFEPGLYIIENGSFDFNGGNHSGDSLSAVVGTGVTFYVASTANLALAGNVQLNVTAPSSGTYAGILFFGSRDATSVSNQISGTSDTTLHGAIYAPASHVEFAGNSTISNGCTQVVASRVTLTGNSTLEADCTGAGTRAIMINESVLIKE